MQPQLGIWKTTSSNNLVQQYHKGNDTYRHSPQRKVNKQHVSQLEKDRNLINIIVMHVQEIKWSLRTRIPIDIKPENS